MECERDDVADELGRQGRYFRRERRGERRDVVAFVGSKAAGFEHAPDIPVVDCGGGQCGGSGAGAEERFGHAEANPGLAFAH